MSLGKSSGGDKRHAGLLILVYKTQQQLWLLISDVSTPPKSDQSCGAIHWGRLRTMTTPLPSQAWWSLSWGDTKDLATIMSLTGKTTLCKHRERERESKTRGSCTLWATTHYLLWWQFGREINQDLEWNHLWHLHQWHHWWSISTKIYIGRCTSKAISATLIIFINWSIFGDLLLEKNHFRFLNLISYFRFNFFNLQKFPTTLMWPW